MNVWKQQAFIGLLDLLNLPCSKGNPYKGKVYGYETFIHFYKRIVLKRCDLQHIFFEAVKT